MEKKYHSQRYNLNEEFFDVWSPEMAYVLGFWFADGFMRHEKSYRIAFFSQDKQILEDIREQLKSNHPIREHQSDQCWEIIFFSKHLYKRLEELGGLRKKSLVITFPKVPTIYLRDFIRGYFDGDGSVCRVHYTSTKDQRSRLELRSNFTSGSKAFLETLMEILRERVDLKQKVLCSFNEGHSWKLGYGIKETKKLLAFLYYPECSIALERKKNFLVNNNIKIV